MPILEVHHIEKHFGATRVLEDIGFDLEQGVKTVELDPGTEHYYLEVKRLAGTLPQNAPEN